jgi:hypothetical protein
VGHLEHQPCHLVSISRVLCMLDGRLGKVVGLTPCRGAGVELRNDVRFAPRQLGVEQLAEEWVIAVPISAAIQREHQEVAALQPIEHATGSCATGGDVAERARHPVEDRRTGQERHVRTRDTLEELRSEVVADEAIVPGEPEGALYTRSGVDGQRREVQTRRPTLSTVDQLVSEVVSRCDTGAHEQRPCFRRAHRELIDPDLDDAATGTKERYGHRHLLSGSDGHLRSNRETERQLGDDVATPTVSDCFGIVEDDCHGGGHRRDGRDQGGDAGRAGTG